MKKYRLFLCAALLIFWLNPSVEIGSFGTTGQVLFVTLHPLPSISCGVRARHYVGGREVRLFSEDEEYHRSVSWMSGVGWYTAKCKP